MFQQECRYLVNAINMLFLKCVEIFLLHCHSSLRTEEFPLRQFSLHFSTGWRKVNAIHVCFSSVTQSSSSEGLVSDAVIITAALCLPTTMHLAFISTTFLHPSSLSHQLTSLHTRQTFTRWSSSASKSHFTLNIYSQSISYITPFIKSYYNSICL